MTFCGPFASHDSNLYPTRSGIARYNATKRGGKALDPWALRRESKTSTGKLGPTGFCYLCSKTKWPPFTFLCSRAVFACFLGGGGIHSQFSFLGNENAIFTQSLLCSLFALFRSQRMVHYRANHVHIFTVITRILATEL